jgi:RNA polymerase sigma-70 factor, ECF subfamily
MAEQWKEAASSAMERYACGDARAFVVLYDLLEPRLSSFLSRRTRDPSHAEDLVQQTFLHIHRARSQFSAGSDVVPWAFAIARRLFIDSIRRHVRECFSEDQPVDEQRDSTPPEESPDVLAGRQRLARRIDEELARLPEAQRVAFELVQRDGLSMAETAQVLGTTVAAVKLRAFRTYEALRAVLGELVHDELQPWQ